MKIIIDTNFFLIPEKFKVDIFKEFDRIVDKKYELLTIDLVKKELENLSKGRSKDARAAKFGLKLFKSKDIKVLNTKQKDNADKAILKLSEKFSNCAVATLDKELRQKILESGTKVIYLRNKKYLVLR